MKGAATRASLRAKGIWACARLPSRAARLAGNARGARPTFAALAGWPEWLGLPEDRQQRIGAVAALLDAREALAGEIDGARLRTYADTVGGETLEAIAADDYAGSAALPPPEDLTRLSARLLAASLDRSAAELAGLAPHPEPVTAALVRRAEALCRNEALGRKTQP